MKKNIKQKMDWRTSELSYRSSFTVQLGEWQENFQYNDRGVIAEYDEVSIYPAIVNKKRAFLVWTDRVDAIYRYRDSEQFIVTFREGVLALLCHNQWKHFNKKEMEMMFRPESWEHLGVSSDEFLRGNHSIKLKQESKNEVSFLTPAFRGSEKIFLNRTFARYENEEGYSDQHHYLEAIGFEEGVSMLISRADPFGWVFEDEEKAMKKEAQKEAEVKDEI